MPPAVETTEIRYLGDLQRIELKPGDRLVIKCPGIISDATADRIREQVKSVFGDVPVVVLSQGMEIGIVGR